MRERERERVRERKREKERESLDERGFAKKKPKNLGEKNGKSRVFGRVYVHSPFRVFFELQTLSGNSIEILEKLRYGSLTANNLQYTCKKSATNNLYSNLANVSLPLDASLFEQTWF